MPPQHLDRERALKPRVPSAVNITDSARANRGDDLVGSEARSGEMGIWSGATSPVRADDEERAATFERSVQ